ncbi:MAG: phosphoribosylanthranilate isomerase [Desulfuromonadaceae bacterium]|nr:phosphoribosylanthranilate isomerase [Desulfuromonadaceae bacterium]
MTLFQQPAAIRVKICGITKLDDALAAIAAGADALGFVFYARSPRCVEVEQVQRMIAQLPPFVARVGLFVNALPQQVEQTVRACRLDVVQLHGDESPQDCCYEGVQVVKALRVREPGDLQRINDYREHSPVCAFLLDAWVADAYGGTGTLGRWDLAAQAACSVPVILAGGLTPDNVAEAVAAVRPYAVDVSSGVECSPGVKDAQKVQLFVARAKQPLKQEME